MTPGHTKCADEWAQEAPDVHFRPGAGRSQRRLEAGGARSGRRPCSHRGHHAGGGAVKVPQRDRDKRAGRPHVESDIGREPGSVTVGGAGDGGRGSEGVLHVGNYVLEDGTDLTYLQPEQASLVVVINRPADPREQAGNGQAERHYHRRHDVAACVPPPGHGRGYLVC